MLVQAQSSAFALPSFAGPNSTRIVLLSDDLAGACDAAAQFLRTGRSVRVWFGPSVRFSVPESVQAFTTNSRSLSPHDAASAVSHAAATLGSDPNSLFFKSVDSAVNGPLADELLAAHSVLSTRAILLAPAFPYAGRIVRNGILEIHDTAPDGGGKPQHFLLAGLFPPSSRPNIGIIFQPSDLAPAFESGKTVLLCDSVTQSDLNSLASAAQDLPGLLYAGSVGLAHALASLNRVNQPPVPVPPAERTLIIAASQHPNAVADSQLQTLDPDRFPGVHILRLRSHFIASARMRSAFRSFAPQALVLIGGETALLAVHALEAESFVLQGELAPGIPWGLIQGGAAHGCTVVTTSGAFGAASTPNDILAALRGPE